MSALGRKLPLGRLKVLTVVEDNLHPAAIFGQPPVRIGEAQPEQLEALDGSAQAIVVEVPTVTGSQVRQLACA